MHTQPRSQYLSITPVSTNNIAGENNYKIKNIEKKKRNDDITAEVRLELD